MSDSQDLDAIVSTASSLDLQRQREYWMAWQKHMAEFDWGRVVDICNYVDTNIIAPAICISLLPELATPFSSTSTTYPNPSSSSASLLAPIHSTSSVVIPSIKEDEALEVLSCLKSDSDCSSPSEEERTSSFQKTTTKKGDGKVRRSKTPKTIAEMKKWSDSLSSSLETLNDSTCAPADSSAKRRRSM